MAPRLRSAVARVISGRAIGPELNAPLPHAEAVAVATLLQVSQYVCEQALTACRRNAQRQSIASLTILLNPLHPH
jgi:hypothetical protein